MSAEADKSFGMHSYEKWPRRFFRMSRCKFIALKVPWNQSFMDVWKRRSALALGYGRNSSGMHSYEGNNILDKSSGLGYTLAQVRDMKKPKTLQQAILYFADPDNCLKWVVKLRWPNGVECPSCGRTDARFLANQRKWQCKSVHHHRQFSAKVGTIFEDSPITLDKWLVAVWLIANCKNGISSYEIARSIGVTQKSAWFMLHRIRLAMQTGSFLKLGRNGSEVEADETFIGGAARNMHRDKHHRRITATGSKDKTPVFGILERGGEVRASVVPTRRKKALQTEIRKHVAAGSAVYTD